MEMNGSTAKTLLPSVLEGETLSQQGAAYFELIKPRVTLMVVLTAAVGFYLASGPSFNFLLFLHTLLGTALLSGGTAVLNQYMERQADSKMRRTSRRPLPVGIIAPIEALVFGMVLVSVGTFYLLATTNALTAGIGWLTSAVYLLVYTPLKVKSPLCTLVGAFPGATPPLMGWAAASGSLNLDALVLFGILFTWQFPHFLAIAWIYKEDYERGGFVMLPPEDTLGKWTGRKILVFSLALLGLSMMPSFLRLSGEVYLVGALFLGMAFAWLGLHVYLKRTKASARLLLRASVIYLPLLLILMTVDKL